MLRRMDFSSANDKVQEHMSIAWSRNVTETIRLSNLDIDTLVLHWPP